MGRNPLGDSARSLQERNDVILLINSFKENVNEKARASLAKAFLEDEASRHASQERSREYLIKKEEEEAGDPIWQWPVLYFILGILFMITVDNIAWNWKELVESFFQIF
jgi:hypothetical protein